jgi:hypothetical protein
MNEAPARISMIMQVTRVAPITLCQNDAQLSAPCHQAMASEPSTPQAAHSVAVAQPSSSDRNTSVMSSRQGIRLSDSEILRRHGIGGSGGGVLPGCSSDHSAM